MNAETQRINIPCTHCKISKDCPFIENIEQIQKSSPRYFYPEAAREARRYIYLKALGKDCKRTDEFRV